MISLNGIEKLFYRFRKAGSGLFTYDCALCGKPVRGKCLCENCGKNLFPARNEESGKAAAYYYEGAPKAVVLKRKFYGGEYCMDALVDWLTEAYSHFDGIKFDFAVPVPAFGGGKNFAYKLAKEFSLLEDIPFEPSVLRKIRKTNKQHKISMAERKTNLIDAFEADEKAKGKTILLIDDIITTGSTAYECSKALIKSGAARVCVLTVLKSAYDK